MNVERIRVDRKKARDLYRKYKEHQHYAAPIDREIQRAYQLIAQGRVVIRARESIRLAGLDEQQRPRLAIANAVSRDCHVELWADGSACFTYQRWANYRDQRRTIRLAAGSFTGVKEHVSNVHCQVPLIPIHLRPKRGLSNYYILFEAEWRPIPPRDPYLLRRIGGDLWLVVAAWDLTEVERAVMATRVSG